MAKFRRFEGAFSWFFIELETHFVERDICFIATAQRPNSSYNKEYIAYLLRMRETAIFHFQIWRHHCVPRPRFPTSRVNFGDCAINEGFMAYFYCAYAKRPYFHFRAKIGCHHRVPRPQFPIRRENLGDFTINKGFMAYFYCACSKRSFFYFRSKIWRHRRVPQPRFPIRRGNFGDSAINKGYIAYFLLRMRETAMFPLPIWGRFQ